MARRIKLVSDGTVPGTKVYAIDPTGVNAPEPIQRVQAVAWRIDTTTRQRIADVTIKVYGAAIEVEGDELADDHEHAWDYIYEDQERPTLRICTGCGAQQDLRDLDWDARGGG